MTISFNSNSLILPYLAPTLVQTSQANSESRTAPTIGTLPNDVLRELFEKHLFPQESIPLALVCRRFRTLCRIPMKELSPKNNRACFLSAMCDAAKRGDLALLKWYHETLKCPLDKRIYNAAAEGGHLGVLQWARANGCSRDGWTCSLAAVKGHLAVLQWARANGCPWDEETCEEAAKYGHLEVLQWARTNGCPWNAETWWQADSSVKQWLRANGCPGAE